MILLSDFLALSLSLSLFFSLSILLYSVDLISKVEFFFGLEIDSNWILGYVTMLKIEQ